MHEEMNVFDFVSNFLGIRIGLKISRSDIVTEINMYIRENRNILQEHPIGPRNFRVLNELKDFFEDCSLIQDLRTTEDEKKSRRERGVPYKKMIIPETMKHTDIMHYLKFCERKYSDPYILNEEDLKNQKIFINAISEELFSVIQNSP